MASRLNLRINLTSRYHDFRQPISSASSTAEQQASSGSTSVPTPAFSPPSSPWLRWHQCEYFSLILSSSSSLFPPFCSPRSYLLFSRAPTTGGQYHWVSEFSPTSLQKPLSYTVGWLCCLGWQVGNTSVAFLASQQISGLVVLNNPDYVPERWHLTLLVIGLMTFCQLFNTFFASKLPLVEGVLVLALHLGGFVGILITLWVCGVGKRGDVREVFLGFEDGGGCKYLPLAKYASCV